MLKKYECLIEIKVVYSPYRWREGIDRKMTQTIEKLKATVEELGGKIRVRY